jgi:hypothetical protein
LYDPLCGPQYYSILHWLSHSLTPHSLLAFVFYRLSFTVQLNAHIDNITAIVQRIPTGSVVHHIYSRLLKFFIDEQTTTGTLSADHLGMFAAVHKTVDPSLSYDAMAASLLTSLASPSSVTTSSSSSANSGVHEEGDGEQTKSCGASVKILRSIVHKVSLELSAYFDGGRLMEALLSFDVSSSTWSVSDEQNRVRLMLQCATLYASALGVRYGLSRDSGEVMNGSSNESEAIRKARSKLLYVRKLLLTWCCQDYGPRCRARLDKKKDTCKQRSDDLVGAGVPDYTSVLSGLPVIAESLPGWLNTMRCVLFLERADSVVLRKFVTQSDGVASGGGGGSGDDSQWSRESDGFEICRLYGSDIDDECLWVVLKSCTDNGISSQMAMLMIEHLVMGCCKDYPGRLIATDAMIVWEMYNLVKYTHQNKGKEIIDGGINGDRNGAHHMSVDQVSQRSRLDSISGHEKDGPR